MSYVYAAVKLEPKSTVSVRVDASTLDAIDSFAKNHSVRRSEALVHFIEAGIKFEQSAQPQPEDIAARLDKIETTLNRLVEYTTGTALIPFGNTGDPAAPQLDDLEAPQPLRHDSSSPRQHAINSDVASSSFNDQESGGSVNNPPTRKSVSSISSELR